MAENTAQQLVDAAPQRPLRGAGKRGKEVERAKVAVFVELVRRCLNSRTCKLSAYDFVDFAVSQGLSPATVTLLLRRLKETGIIGRPRKSIICCAPLLEKLGVQKSCEC